MPKTKIEKIQALQTATLVFTWGIIAAQVLVIIGKLVAFIQ